MGNERLKPLGELVRNFDARRVPLSSRERANRRGPYPYYGATGVMDYVDEYLFEGLHLLVAEDGSVERDDGRPFLQLVDGRFWVNNHAHVLRGATDEDTRYLFYALNAVPIRPFVSGSVQAKLSQANLNRVPVPYPEDEAERRAIAQTLRSLDDKIELNRRMSETLEAMARALFQSWFVEFDPVRARAEDRDPGLPEPIADLFPDRFDESIAGAIPAGWIVEPLGEAVDVERGLSYHGSGLSAVGLPMHNLNSIYEGGGYKPDGLKFYTGDYKPWHVARPGDVLVANTEQGHDRLLIGYSAVVPRYLKGDGIFSHHLYRVRPKQGSRIKPFYLCHLLNTPAMHDIVSGYANGTTVNMLPIDGLLKPLVAIPPDDVLAHFETCATAFHGRQEVALQESRALAAIRDALLPKLISGELRVPQAERLLEAAPA
jgi:type I restriction enzyme S subunit